MNYSPKAASSADEFCTAALRSSPKLNRSFERWLTPGGVCISGDGGPTALGASAAARGPGRERGIAHFSCRRAPLCPAGAACFVPSLEAQRGQVVCLRPHSEQVTMATWYLSVPVLRALLETPPHPSSLPGKLRWSTLALSKRLPTRNH